MLHIGWINSSPIDKSKLVVSCKYTTKWKTEKHYRMRWRRKNIATSSMKELWFFTCALAAINFLIGGRKDHARPHRAVCPWTNSVVFKMEAPTSRTFDTKNFKFTFLPTIDVNHLIAIMNINLMIHEEQHQIITKFNYWSST